MLVMRRSRAYEGIASFGVRTGQCFDHGYTSIRFSSEMLLSTDTMKGAAWEVMAAVPIGRTSRVLGEGRYQPCFGPTACITYSKDHLGPPHDNFCSNSSSAPAPAPAPSDT
jgi:hypothetical protein